MDCEHPEATGTRSRRRSAGSRAPVGAGRTNEELQRVLRVAEIRYRTAGARSAEGVVAAVQQAGFVGCVFQPPSREPRLRRPSP